MSKKVKELINKINAWTKHNAAELYMLLSELADIAEKRGQELEGIISPDDIPTAPLPLDKNLTHVWAVDVHGMALVRGHRGKSVGKFRIIPASELPDAKHAGELTRKVQYKNTSITVRIPPEIREAIEKSMRRNFERNMSDWLRGAIVKRLKDEELL